MQFDIPDVQPPKLRPGFNPSPQQAEIFNWVSTGSGNAAISAVAGSGKTTTLIEAMALMEGDVVMTAFNKKIVEEIEYKLGARQIEAKANTFHSIGMSAWRRSNPRVRVDKNKTYKVMDDLKIDDDHHAYVKKMVGFAKQAMFGHWSGSPIIETSAWDLIHFHFGMDFEIPKKEPNLDVLYNECIDVLNESNSRGNMSIDFDDMLYLPLLNQSRFYPNDWVLIDEAQDTNTARRLIAAQILKSGGRLIAVGDPRQAIYGFSGADDTAFDLLSEKFNCVPLPLTVSYRCPQAVVAIAQRYVDHIQAHPDAPEGLASSLSNEDFHSLPDDQFTPQSAILCRNTAPLIELAYWLLGRDIRCHVEGRDIGAGLIRILDKFPEIVKLTTLLDNIDKYMDTLVETASKKKAESRIGQLEDQRAALHMIAGKLPPGSTADDMRKKIYNLFQDTEGPPRDVTLSTIHKSKGREWDRVFWYGGNKYQPSKYASQEWQQFQEENLMYVAATRAKSELWEVYA